MPILPMVLVNGAEGIGTGWSTFIPNYSPREIAANLKRLLQGLPLEPMQPWYKGFK
jgi:DNA topoisomerase-2